MKCREATGDGWTAEKNWESLVTQKPSKQSLDPAH